MSCDFMRRSSSQAPLIESHISTVRAVRTARAFSRAISMQLRIEEGLFGLKARKSRTVASLGDVVEALELVKVAGDQNRAFPLVALAAVARGQRREAQRRVEDPRNEIGALRVARHPVEIVGRAGQHGGLHRYANAPGNWFSHRAPMCPWSPRLGSSSRQASLPSARRA